MKAIILDSHPVLFVNVLKTNVAEFLGNAEPSRVRIITKNDVIHIKRPALLMTGRTLRPNIFVKVKNIVKVSYITNPCQRWYSISGW